MNLSTRLSITTVLGVALGMLLPAVASAQLPPAYRQIPSTYYGYETTLLLQAYWRNYEQASTTPRTAYPPGTTFVQRTVTGIGPDNNARTIVIEVPVLPSAQATPGRMVRYGANR